MNQFYQRIAVTCAISIAMLASVHSQGLVKEQFFSGKNRTQTNFIRLGELCDSLQGELDLPEREVVPVRSQGSKTMRRLDDRALRATLTDMFEKLGLDMTLPNRFTPRNANVIFAAILEAAAITPPTVETLAAEDIESAMATLFGIITDDGRQPLDYWGFKFGTDSSLTDSIHVPFGDYQGFLDTSAVDTGAFSFGQTALARYTTYYYAAWGENQHGIAHGDTLSFTTLPELASGLSISSSNLAANSADVSLSFTDNGGQGPDSVGFWWDTELFTLENFDGDSALSSSTGDPYGYSLSGLTRYTKYYFTGYAGNLGGRAFVQQPDSFLTLPEAPEVALSWNAEAARLEGTVTDLGGDYGAPLPDSTFVVLDTQADLSTGDTLVTTYSSVDSSFTALGSAFSLQPGEAYYAVGYAVNAAGTGSSTTVGVNTLVASSTDSVTAIAAHTAALHGSFDFGGLAPTEVGFKWSASADLSGAVDSVITLAADSTIALGVGGLTGETTYYFTAFATNLAGTSYGDTLTFTTKTAISQLNLFAAVEAWCADSVATTVTYGHISNWDVSACNYMTDLFMGEGLFNSDIGGWDVSAVTSMKRMFRNCQVFNQDLSSWDVSSVTTMEAMFNNCKAFDQDLSDWEVGSVLTFQSCFMGCHLFNSELNDWDVSSASNTSQMFQDARVFNQPLSNWDVSSVTDMGSMFRGARKFNQSIGQWDVSAVTYMFGLFAFTEDFNQPLGTWDVSGVTTMGEIFNNSKSFDQDLSSWDVSKVESFRDAFRECNFFTSDLSTWDVSAVKDMSGMFNGDSLFNSSIGNWNTSSVTTMYGMFGYTENFNQDLSSWDVSSVTDFSWMFTESIFNSNLNSWNMSAAKDISGMFSANDSFNQPLDAWDVSSVTNMLALFWQAQSFNGDLSGWDVGAVENMRGMFYDTDFNGDIGSWDVSSVRNFEAMFKSDSLFNRSLNAWDVSAATKMKSMFESAIAFNQPLDAWDVSSVTDVEAMFMQGKAFNQDLNNWDVSGLQSLRNMFFAAENFNGNVSAWDVSSVTDMSGTFWSTAFDQDVSAWDVSSVKGFVNFDEFSTANLDAIYTAWAGLSLSTGVNLQLHGNSKYCYASGARQSIIDNYGWTITDGGSACDPAPSAVTGLASNVATTSADVAGSFANMSTVTEAGFKVSTDSTLAGATNQSAGSASPFTLSLTDLTPNTVYYYRAYAADEIGTAQGDSTKSFQTQGPPLVSSIADTAWTDTTATLRGSIDFAVLPAITTTGFKYSSQPDLSGATDVAGDALVDTFTYALTATGPLYYTAYATNALGTTYGDTLQLAGSPETRTEVATGVTETEATLNGSIVSAARRVITATGFTWGYESDLSDGQATAGDALSGEFSADLTGLSNGSTLYFSAFITSEAGTIYGDTLSRCLMVCEPAVFDGYEYETVAVGCQCWFAENLRTTIYNNGDSIPSDLDAATWSSTTEGALAVQYGDETQVDGNGRYYNFHAVTDSRGLCPTGWRIPYGQSDVYDLVNLYGGVNTAGPALKSSSTDTPSWDGTNESGFSLVAAGSRPYGGTAYNATGVTGFMWSIGMGATANPFPFYAQIGQAWFKLFSGGQNTNNGYPVRCIRSDASVPSVSTGDMPVVTDSTAVLSATAFDGWSSLTATGFKWGYASDLSDGAVVSGDTIAGEFSVELTDLVTDDSLYYVAFATNALGTTFGDTLSVLVRTAPCANLDQVFYDDHVYELVAIGEQCWFAENLRNTHYANGDAIPGELSDGEWGATTVGAQAVDDNDAANLTTYGRLYNWYAVDDARGLCPSGWHVPTDGEYTELENHLGGGTDANSQMKSSPSDSPSWDGSNNSGFSALPTGFRYDNGSFGTDLYASFWSSSPNGTSAWYRRLYPGDGNGVGRGYDDQLRGYSVRCVLTVASAPSVSTGDMPVVTGSTAFFSATAFDEWSSLTATGFKWGYASDLSDGTVVSGDTIAGEFSVELTDLVTNDSLYYVAFATNALGTSFGDTLSVFVPTPPCANLDQVLYDDHVYDLVNIGEQCWFAENLRNTHYANGDAIPGELSNGEWGATTAGAQAVYDNDAANLTTYGRLYNWHAVDDARGLCPSGWHVPTDGEYTELENYLGGGTDAHSRMKSAPSDSPSWDGSNNSGFSALPGGFCTDLRYFNGVGDYTYFWSSSPSSSLAWCRELNSGNDAVGQISVPLSYGFSVRCVRD